MPLGRQSARHLGAIPPPIAPWLLMLGDEAGMLTVLFDPKTRKLLGVHAQGCARPKLFTFAKRRLSIVGRSNISAT
jgi:hypothetical protein